jgi:hypothetical protein
MPCSGQFGTIVVMHYHKTGNALTARLFVGSGLAHALNLTHATRLNFRRVEPAEKDLRDLLLYDDLTLIPGPELSVVALRAQAQLLNCVAPRLVHFVRDPFRVVASGFVYHSSLGTRELWLSDATFDPCFVSPEARARGVARLANFASLHKACSDVWLEYMSGVGSAQRRRSYREALRMLPQGAGLRLEALRALISSDVNAGGDLPRMMRMSEMLHNDPLSLELSLDDAFGEGGSAAFDAAIGCIHSFLDLGQRQPVGVSLADTLRMARTFDMSRSAEADRLRDGRHHSTRALVNGSAVAAMQWQLETDEVVASALHTIATALVARQHERCNACNLSRRPTESLSRRRCAGP